MKYSTHGFIDVQAKQRWRSTSGAQHEIVCGRKGLKDPSTASSPLSSFVCLSENWKEFTVKRNYNELRFENDPNAAAEISDNILNKS